MGCIVIAGVTSSVGKTTVSVGIMDAFRRRGLKVQPFKVGPDYIDPSYHTSPEDKDARPSRNLDSWMLPASCLLELYHRAMSGADIGVVEGVMGLYDGYSGREDVGSTAHVAKLLKAPVVLVVDVSHAARSIAATVLGFRRFDPEVELAGVVLNCAGSPGHVNTVVDAIKSSVELPVLGYLPRRPELVLPHRHLGLVPTAEGAPAAAFRQSLSREVEANFDIDALRLLADSRQSPPSPVSGLFPPDTMPVRTAIAVARDEAFNFYYQDNLDLLQAWGAELVQFSPLHDRALPERVGAMYLGGGFPEIFAAALSANASLIDSIKAAARRGMPIYAECGGLMYLSEAIVDLEGALHPMAGIVPGKTVIHKGRLSLGYAEVEARGPGPLMEKGVRARGHEFHYSQWLGESTADGAAYSIVNRGGKSEGFLLRNVLASYVHLHFGSNPALAPHFVKASEACLAGRRLSRSVPIVFDEGDLRSERR